MAKASNRNLSLSNTIKYNNKDDIKASKDINNSIISVPGTLITNTSEVFGYRNQDYKIQACHKVKPVFIRIILIRTTYKIPPPK